jgi:hypothetical protein
MSGRREYRLLAFPRAGNSSGAPQGTGKVLKTRRFGYFFNISLALPPFRERPLQVTTSV